MYNGPISADEQRLLADIIVYFDNIVTVKAKFIETDSTTKEVRTGRIWLWRPGKARLEYDLPIPDLIPSTIVANGIYIYLYTEKEGEKHVDLDELDENPLSLILHKPMTSGTDIILTRLEHSNNDINISVTKNNKINKAALRLYFTKDPLKLKGWTMPGPRGSAITVALSEIQIGLSLDQKLFQPIFPPVKHD